MEARQRVFDHSNPETSPARLPPREGFENPSGLWFFESALIAPNCWMTELGMLSIHQHFKQSRKPAFSAPITQAPDPLSPDTTS
jgi:hypothetical protein